ncbi:hypothetical protein ACFQH6_03290 [Halobacteriaceae archaeon GCM10025711]
MAKGDPRVHLVMNLVLSLVYSLVVVWGLSFLGFLEFTLQNVAIATLVIAALTFVVVR